MPQKIRKIEKIVNDETLLVTVDIGKVRNTGYMRCPNGTEMMPFDFCNHIYGFQKFYRCIQWMKRRQELRRVVIGVESTGAYAQPLLQYLKNKRVKLVQVNTYHTKRVKEILDNSPGKTDKKDPQVMADILELGRYLTVVIPEGIVAKLRELIHNRESYLHDSKTLLNRLNSQVYRIFPEFDQVIKNLKTKTAHHLLYHYTDPNELVKLGVDKLSEIVKKQSHGKISPKRIKMLYQSAQQTVGLKEEKEIIVCNIKHILEQIELLHEFIEGCKFEISKELTKVPYSHLLTGIKGIKEITAAAIIGEVADFGKFKRYAELEKYAGLNLYEISSGKRKGQKRIAKRGRHLLRKFLYFASLRMIRKNGIYHEQYQNYIKRGMPGTKAVVAICRKLLRVIFAIVRDHREFSANIQMIKMLPKAA